MASRSDSEQRSHKLLKSSTLRIIVVPGDCKAWVTLGTHPCDLLAQACLTTQDGSLLVLEGVRTLGVTSSSLRNSC